MADGGGRIEAEEPILIPVRLMVDELAAHDFDAAKRIHDLLDQCEALMRRRRELMHMCTEEPQWR